MLIHMNRPYIKHMVLNFLYAIDFCNLYLSLLKVIARFFLNLNFNLSLYVDKETESHYCITRKYLKY